MISASRPTVSTGRDRRLPLTLVTLPVFLVIVRGRRCPAIGAGRLPSLDLELVEDYIGFANQVETVYERKEEKRGRKSSNKNTMVF